MPEDKKNELPPEIRDLQLAYHRLFSSEDGQKVLEDMKQAAFFYRSIMSDTDRKCFRNEGAREFVIRIVNILAKTKPQGDQKQ